MTILGGQRDTAQGSFSSAAASGKISYYLTGLFLQSNLGFSSAVPHPIPIHDAVTQGQGFAYLTYQSESEVKLSLISGMTLVVQPVPQSARTRRRNTSSITSIRRFYPSSAINSGLNQQDYYGVLALNGTVGSKTDYQLAYSAHYNTQTFYPDPIGDLIYQGISSNVFTSDLSNTLQGDLTYQFGARTHYAAAFTLASMAWSRIRLRRCFRSSMGTSRHHAGFADGQSEQNQSRVRSIYTRHLADHRQTKREFRFAMGPGRRGFTIDSQFSPTINFVYKPSADTTLHAGFARNFQVPNFQNVSSGIFTLFAAPPAR